MGELADFQTDRQNVSWRGQFIVVVVVYTFFSDRVMPPRQMQYDYITKKIAFVILPEYIAVKNRYRKRPGILTDRHKMDKCKVRSVYKKIYGNDFFNRCCLVCIDIFRPLNYAVTHTF